MQSIPRQLPPKNMGKDSFCFSPWKLRIDSPQKKMPQTSPKSSRSEAMKTVVVQIQHLKTETQHPNDWWSVRI